MSLNCGHQMIYEYGETRWNGLDRGETLDLSTGALWQSYQQSHLAVNKEEFGEENDEFSLRSISVYTSKCAADFYRP
jgi:hypothetical protein